MNQSELNKILEEHKKWLRTGGLEGKRADLSSADLRYADLSYADLRSADLSSADLRSADLSSADLDYSVFPLWCGGLNVHIDDKQAIQLLYHLVKNVLYSKNTSDELKALMSNEAIINKANKFHRVNECGLIAVNKERERMTYKEALEILYKGIAPNPTANNECINLCKKALEKQIPKKPIKYDNCEQFFIECPCCQKRFDSRLGYKGCPYCLQAIRLE